MFNLCDKAFAEGGHDVLAKHEPVVRHRCRLAVHLNILALVALGEVGDGRNGRRLRRDRWLTLLDSRDDCRGVLAGALGRELGIRAEGHALRAAEGAGLDDEHFLAARVDADAETGNDPRSQKMASFPLTERRSKTRLERVRYWACAMFRCSCESDLGGLDRHQRRKRLGSARGSSLRCKHG